MNRTPGPEAIHAWWEGRPEERYWLDITRRPDRDKFLAAPRGEGANASGWSHRLITCVRSGDVVFHYDAAQAGIVGASVAHGRVGKGKLGWPVSSGSDGEEIRKMRSWRIALRHSTLLESVVPLREIAQIQWSLFPALRSLEDEVGDPLYYPFEMGNREDTRPLAGYVLKLPAILVREIPGLANVAVRWSRSREGIERSSLRASGVRAAAGEREPRRIPTSPYPGVTSSR